MMKQIFVFLLFSVILLRGQGLTYSQGSSDVETIDTAMDAQGNIYTLAKTSATAALASEGSFVFSVSKLDSSQHVVFRYGLRSSVDGFTPKALAVDPREGSVVIGGNITMGFLSVKPLFPVTSGLPSGFVMKLNPAGDAVVFATPIGGADASKTGSAGTSVESVAAGADGEIYVGGSTAASDFPVTAGAFQTLGGGTASTLGAAVDGFVIKLSGDGQTLRFATYLGGTKFLCDGGSNCLGLFRNTVIKKLLVRNNGDVIAVGGTNTTDFPVTAGALQNTCRCDRMAGDGFISEFNVNGSQLVASTLLGGNPFGFSPFIEGTELFTGGALLSDDSVALWGTSGSQDFPTTAGAVVATPGPPPSNGQEYRRTVYARVSPTLNRLIAGTYLPGTETSTLVGGSVDGTGHVWMGLEYQRLDGIGVSRLVEISQDATTLVRELTGPRGSFGLATLAKADGSVVQVGTRGVLWTQSSGLGAIALAPSAGTASIDGGIAPGELLTLYGAGLTDGSAASATVDANGRIPTQLAGLQVMFDGVAAPLLYVGPGQVNLVVPMGVADKAATTMTVSTGRFGGVGSFTAGGLRVLPSVPSVFLTAGGTAAALDEAGVPITKSHPAKGGSVVALFISGGGLYDRPVTDGELATTPYASLKDAPQVMFDNSLATNLEYSGAAPGLVYGVSQINVRVPQGINDSVQIRLGNAQGFTEAVTLPTQ